MATDTRIPRVGSVVSLASQPPMLFRKFLTPVVSIVLVATLAVAFSTMRALGTIGPTNLRWLLPLGFVAMSLLPWMLLTPHGRNQIGFRKPSGSSWFLSALGFGSLAAILCYISGYVLFGESSNNWYVTIGNSYKGIMDTSGMSFWILNAMFTIPAMIFSPIGEEIFFRGILQDTLEQKLSRFQSTFIECGLFGLVHLCHHGIIKSATGLNLLPVSGSLWVAHMFLVALMFAWLRKRSGSLYVAIVAHAAFNVTMNVLIFSFLW